MLEEIKVIDRNHKGSISLSCELIKKIIFFLAKDNINFLVKNVELQQINETAKTILIIEFDKDKKTQFYGNLITDYLKNLNLYINLNLNITNINIILVFN